MSATFVVRVRQPKSDSEESRRAPTGWLDMALDLPQV